MPSAPNDGSAMMIQMSFDNNLFGQIMLEFKEEDQFQIDSFSNDFHNYKFMTIPKDAEYVTVSISTTVLNFFLNSFF